MKVPYLAGSFVLRRRHVDARATQCNQEHWRDSFSLCNGYLGRVCRLYFFDQSRGTSRPESKPLNPLWALPSTLIPEGKTAWATSLRCVGV